jgi:hypothetical protein
MSDKALTLMSYAFYVLGSLCFIVGTCISGWMVLRK